MPQGACDSLVPGMRLFPLLILMLLVMLGEVEMGKVIGEDVEQGRREGGDGGGKVSEQRKLVGQGIFGGSVGSSKNVRGDRGREAEHGFGGTQDGRRSIQNQKEEIESKISNRIRGAVNEDNAANDENIDDKERVDIPLLPAGEEDAGKEEDELKAIGENNRNKDKVEAPPAPAAVPPVEEGSLRTNSKIKDGKNDRVTKEGDGQSGEDDGQGAKHGNKAGVGKRQEDDAFDGQQRRAVPVEGEDEDGPNVIPRPLTSKVDVIHRMHTERLQKENQFLVGEVESLRQELSLLREENHELSKAKHRLKNNNRILKLRAKDIRKWGEREEALVLSSQEKARRLKRVARHEHSSRVHDVKAKNKKIGALEKEMEKEQVQHRLILQQSQMLKDMLKEDKEMLRELKERADNPDIKLWLNKRVKRMAQYLDNPETEALASFATRYITGSMEKGLSKLSEVERKVKKGTGKVVPEKYGSLVGLVLTLILVGLPIGFTTYAFFSFTTLISTRQYVLLGNCFFVLFMVGICMIGILIHEDPLQGLHFISVGNFVGVNFVISILFVVFCIFLVKATYQARSDQEQMTFGGELLIYAAVGMHYHANVWQPAILGYDIVTSWGMYCVYMILFFAMLLATLSVARQRRAQKSSAGGHLELDVEEASSLFGSLVGGSSDRTSKIE